LDNPNPHPVESETISKRIQKNPNIWPELTPKSGSCTPLLQVYWFGDLAIFENIWLQNVWFGEI